MIGSLRGRLLDRDEGEALVEVSGVGYRVMVTPAAVAALGDVGDDVFLHVHHHLREDAETLYGFLGIEERRVFETLIGTHGVGPSLGLAILSVHSPLGLRHLLATDDVAGLCLVPGVGKKTAVRLLVELKSRLTLPDDAESVPAPVGGALDPNPAKSDVREALSALGYGSDEVAAVVSDLPPEGDPAELLKVALQRLAAV